MNKARYRELCVYGSTDVAAVYPWREAVTSRGHRRTLGQWSHRRMLDQ